MESKGSQQFGLAQYLSYHKFKSFRWHVRISDCNVKKLIFQQTTATCSNCINSFNNSQLAFKLEFTKIAKFSDDLPFSYNLMAGGCVKPGRKLSHQNPKFPAHAYFPPIYQSQFFRGGKECNICQEKVDIS